MLDSLEAFIGFRGRDVQGRVRKGVVGERGISLSLETIGCTVVHETI